MTPVMPAEHGNGLAMRAGLLAEGLSRAGEVRLVVAPAFGAPGPPTGLVRRVAASVDVLEDAAGDPVADFRERLAVPAHRERAAALHPRPDLTRVATLGAARRVAEIAAGAGLVVVARLYLAPLLDVLLEQPGRPPLALDVDDIESLTLAQAGDAEQAARFSRLEAAYLEQPDLVLACSAEDAAWLRDHHALANVEVVRNGVRPPQRVDPAPASGGGTDLLFVGNLSHRPNVDAVRWLCGEVMPLLGDARLALVGSDPPAEVLELAGDRVEVAPDVADVAPWYARSRVAVAPLRAGGGTSIKVIEAFAHGRPVVATTHAMRGLSELTESAALLADSPAAFADACASLLADTELAATRAEAGAAIVRRTATADLVAERVATLARAMFAG